MGTRKAKAKENTRGRALRMNFSLLLLVGAGGFEPPTSTMSR
jgi:hypothetical protein